MSADTQGDRLSNIGHWIVLDKAGRVVIAWSEENAAVYRDRLDCEVSGPFVRADQLAEAVDLLRESRRYVAGHAFTQPVGDSVAAALLARIDAALDGGQ